MAEKENRFNFTKAALEGIAPAERRAYVYDTRTRGLAVRIEPTGQKAFYLYRRVNGKPTMLKLGLFPEMSIENARDEISKVNVAIRGGADPAKARRAQRVEMTFSKLFDWYIENHAKPTKKTWYEDEKQNRRYLAALGKRQLSAITKTDIRNLHQHIASEHGPYSANRALSLVRSVFNRALAHDVFDGANPAIGIAMKRERTRDRRLMGDELPRFFTALEAEPNEDIRDYVMISLLTGARQANVLAMRWDEIDQGAKVWRIPETKNGLPQFNPMGEEEIAILARRRAALTSPWVFPGPGKSGHLQEPRKGWERIRTSAGMPDLRLHDLRRTLGSWMADTGAASNIIGKALGHQSQAATAIYARLSLDPVREAKAKAIGALMHARGAE
jgi:integrase